MSAGPASPYKLASLLLQYPTQALFSGLPLLRAAADQVTPRAVREHTRAFCDWLAATPPDAVAKHYVETFDLRRRCALYLTYYRYGDTRKRGMSMVAIKAAYRAAGFTPNTDELPDYLPMVLEFAALSPRGVSLLRAHRRDLELLRRGLAERGSAYQHVLEAVCVTLPRLRRAELAAVAAAWREGPPQEDVGLEPFAPPQYLAGGER